MITLGNIDFMITTKKMILCWAALGIALAVGNMAHEVLQKEAAVIAVKEAPPYESVSDVEAVRLAYETCQRDVNFESMLLQTGTSCKEHFLKPTERTTQSAQEYHRDSYEKREVGSRIDARQSKLRENFETFYYVLAFAAFAVVLLWCKSTVLPRLVNFKDAVRERAPSISELKALGANRKVRQAESDFATLKNLHDNGLINDEMFKKRKDELKASLSSNQVFQE